ncbi:MAG: hypothetical protein GF347_00895, partial [Candidatus Moranbacteria bacterium]|nr:hypothetical protein [Candidatus Moranbacteria bacterium]
MKTKTKYNLIILSFLLLLSLLADEVRASEYDLSNGEVYVFDNVSATRNNVGKIDDAHFLNVYYDHSSGHVSAVILETNTVTGKLTATTPYEIDSTDFSSLNNVDIRVNQIQDSDYLITYRQAGGPRAVILSVDTDSWTISKGANHVLSDAWGLYDLQDTIKIDGNYFLTVYQGANWNGFGKILQIDVGSDTITEVSTVNLGAHSKENCLLSIDGQYFLNISTRSSNGGGRILTVNESGGTITQGSWQIFESGFFWYSAAEKIDDTHYLVSYTGVDLKGWAALLEVDTGSDSVALKNKFDFDEVRGFDNSLERIDSDHVLSVFSGEGNQGWAVVLEVDTSSDVISKAAPNHMFDEALRTESVSSVQIDSDHYLVTYKGADGTGRAVILGLGIEPPKVDFNSKPEPVSVERKADFILIQDESIEYYKYRINGGEYSEVFPISRPINLEGLALGDYEIEVLGVNGYGIWQETPTNYFWQVTDKIDIIGTLYRSTHIQETKHALQKEKQRRICVYTPGGTEKDCDSTDDRAKFVLKGLDDGGDYILYSSV